MTHILTESSRKYTAVLLFGALLLFPMVTACYALAQDEYDQQALELLSLFNEARRAPLEMAVSLGLDPEQLLADLPELEDVLLNGLPELNMDARLAGAAAFHNQDMFLKEYYASVSPEGETVLDRLYAAGYKPKCAGETLGLLTFLNFMESSRAIHHLFANMFLDELKAERIEPRYILNPASVDVGIDVKTGVKTFSGFNYNVYLATCDFTFGEVDETTLGQMERQLALLVNQARVKPAEVVLSLGLDMAGCIDAYPQLNEGFAPFATNQNLATAAQSHSEEMAEFDFVGHDSMDGRFVEDRIAEAGFDALTSSEVIISLAAAESTDTDSAVQALFDRMLARELELSCTESSLFAPDADSIGMGIRLAQLSNEAGERHWYYLATVDMAVSVELQRPNLMGIVYADNNNDGLYTPGEGVPGKPVIYFDAGLHLMTDSVGSVKSALDPGWYLVILHSQTENLQFIEKNVENLNVWFDFEISKQ